MGQVADLVPLDAANIVACRGPQVYARLKASVEGISGHRFDISDLRSLPRPVAARIQTP